MEMSKLVTDKGHDKEVKRDGSDYKTPKGQRKRSHKYYHKNKETLAEKRRLRFMTDPEYRARVLKIKKKNDRVKVAREKARREGISPYLLKINDELVLVNMCNITGLAKFLGRSKRTLDNWIEDGILPLPLYRTGKQFNSIRLYTEFQAIYILECMKECKHYNGVNKKELKKRLADFWKKWPYGFDLDDLEFEGDDE